MTVLCYSCQRPCSLLEHHFEEGLAPASRAAEEAFLERPVAVRRWSYWAPLYHLWVENQVRPFCGPGCVRGPGAAC